MSKSFVAFLSWSIAYLFWGIVAMQFGNDGSNDSKGMRGYFILNLLGYVFSMESLMEVAVLAMLMWGTILPSYRPTCCGRSPLRFFEVLVTLTFLVIASGSLWCSVVSNVWAADAYDDYPNDIAYADVHTCVKMVDIGQVVFTAASALFWISIASIYGSSARQQIEQDDQWYFVGGIPTSLSAAAVICFQTMILTFHLMAFVMQKQAGADPDEDVATTATIAYHYSILMTGYFAHNFIATMSLTNNDSLQKQQYEDEENSSMDQDPSDGSTDRELIKKVKIYQSTDAGRDMDFYDEERNTSSSLCETDDSMRNMDRSLFDDTTVIETVYSESQYAEEHPPTSHTNSDSSEQKEMAIGSPLMMPPTEELRTEATTMMMNSQQHPLSAPTQLVRSNTNDLGPTCTTSLLSFVSEMLFPKSSTDPVETEPNPIQRDAPEEVASEVSSKGGWSSESSISQGIAEPCSIFPCQIPSTPQDSTTVTKSKERNVETGSILSKSIFPIPEERDDSDDKETLVDSMHRSSVLSEPMSSSPPRLLERQPSVSAHSSLFSDATTDAEHPVTLRSFKSMNPQEDPSVSYRDEESQRTRTELRDDLLLENIHIVWAGDV